MLVRETIVAPSGDLRAEVVKRVGRWTPWNAARPGATLRDEMPRSPASRKPVPVPSEDPVLRALLDAPEDDEPVTPEEEAALEESHREVAAGKVISHAELKRKLGL
jgi:hypothetical protein